MMRFALRRSAQAVLTVLAATVVVFTILYVLPGDPIRALFGFRPPPPQVLEELKASYGLDQPYVVQYWRYLGRLVRGDLGRSFMGREVIDILAPAIPRTLVLLGGTLLIELSAVTLLGIATVAGSGGRRDRLAHVLGLVVASLPVVVIAFASQAVLGRWLGILPPEVGSATVRDVGRWILPASVLALWFGAVLLRQLRSDVAGVRNEPYLRTARAKGLSFRRVSTVHALRPAAGPTLNLAGAQVGELLGALIIVEGVFDVGGVGTVVYEALQQRDQATILGAVTAMLIVVIVTTAVVDLLSGVLDPRLRHTGSR